ncbi:MAG: hypothetical protein V3V08_05680 [Nannocystaceae bacterium]
MSNVRAEITINKETWVTNGFACDEFATAHIGESILFCYHVDRTTEVIEALTHARDELVKLRAEPEPVEPDRVAS